MNEELLQAIQEMEANGESPEFIAQFVKEWDTGKITDPQGGATAGSGIQAPVSGVSPSEDTFLELPRIDHVTVDEAKEATSFFHADDTFVEEMNEKYSKYNIEFDTAAIGRSAFTIHSKDSGQTSETVYLPTQMELGGNNWNNVQEKIQSFVDKNSSFSSDYNKQVGEKFEEASLPIKRQISTQLDDEGYLKEILGEDSQNWRWIQPLERGGNGGVGEEDDYKTLTKALKENLMQTLGEQVEETHVLPRSGVSTTRMVTKLPDNITEHDVDIMARDIVTSKFNKAKGLYIQQQEAELTKLMGEQGIDYSSISKITLAHQTGLLNQKQLDVHLAIKKLNELTPGTKEWDEQEKIKDEAFEKAQAWWRQEEQLIDFSTGGYIDGAVEADGGGPGNIVLTKEEREELEKQLAKSDSAVIEEQFYTNGQQKWYSDQKGKEVFDVTINSMQAQMLLKKLGIKPTGSNVNGYEYSIPMSVMGKHYGSLVESKYEYTSLFTYSKEEKEAWEEEFGATRRNYKSKFKSPTGHFGLTMSDDGVTPKQTFEKGFWSGNFEGEFSGKGDLSTRFKREIKDYRTNRVDVIKRGKVLGKTHLLNIDVAKTKTILPEKGFENIGEGLLDLVPNAIVPDIVSSRETKDIMESIVNTTPIRESATMEEGFDRSGLYRVYEGVTGFVPAIVEFALIDVALKKTGAITGIPKLLRAGRGVYKNSKGVRYTAKEVASLEAASGHLAGTKKFNSHVRAVGGSASHNIAGQLGYHAYMGVREEFKMRVAFDEHYHMGGGVGFYGIGALMNNVPNPKLNLLNTLFKFGKSGVAGATSTVAAQNLEAMVRDLKGDETYKTFLNDTYGDLFEGHSEQYDYTDFLTDMAVFSIVGGKAFFKGKGWKYKFYHQGKLNKEYNNQLRKFNEYKQELESGDLSEGVKEKVVEKLEKTNELLDMIENQIKQVDNSFIESDPVLAKKALERQAANTMKVLEPYAPEGVEINVVEGKEKFTDKEAAAEYLDPKQSTSGKHVINVDINDYKHGKMPHEFFHMSLNVLFKKNPKLRIQFKNALKGSFGKEKFYNVEGVEMTIEEMLEVKYKGKSEETKTEEFSAFVVELLANPLNYSRFVQGGVWGTMANEVNKYANRHVGMNVFNSSDSKQNIIRFLGNFATSIKEGKLTDAQFGMLERIGKDNLFDFESIEADMRTTERKAEEQAEVESDKSFKSADVKELSRRTQETYDASVKGKKGEEYNAGIESLIKKDLSNPESVAGEHFDKIIYDIITDRAPNYGLADINAPNRLGYKMMLAFEMVEHIGRGEKAENRGLKGILEEYKNFPEFKDKDGKFVVFDKEGNKKLSETKIVELEEKYKAERGTKEFKDQAVEEGYKGKQNVTKTVGQMLRTRFDEFMISSDLKKEMGREESQKDVYFEEIGAIEERGGYIKELTVEAVEFELGGKGEINTEPKIKISKLKRTNGETVIQPKNLIEQNKLADKFITDIKRSIDFRYQAITDKLSKEKSFKEAGERAVGLDFYDKSKYPDLKPAERYERMAAQVKGISKEAYEVMKKTHDDATSETTWALKSFQWMYSKTGKYFKFAELKGIPDVLKLDKAKGIEKWEKKKQSESGLDLANWILEGSRTDTHKKRAKKVAEALSDVFAVKAVDRAFNVESISKLSEFKDIKTKDGFIKEGYTPELHGLRFEAAIKSVKNLIKGAMPESLASARVEQSKRDLVRVIKTGLGPEKALDYVINKYGFDKDIKTGMLKDLLLGKGREIPIEELMFKQIKAKEILGEEPGVEAVMFDGKFSGKGTNINNEVSKLLTEQVTKHTTFDKTLKDRIAEEKTEDFVYEFLGKDLFPEFGKEIVDILFETEKGGTYFPSKTPLFVTAGGSQYRFGFLPVETRIKKSTGKKVTEPETFTTKHAKTLKEIIVQNIIKNKVKLPNKGKPKFIKINDNDLVKDIVDRNLFKLESGELKNQEAYRKQVMKELSPDGTIEGYYKMEKANEGLLQLVAAKMKSYYNKALKTNDAVKIAKAVDNLMLLMQLQTNLGAGIFRGAATHTAITLERAEKYHSEHEFQMVNFSGNLLLNIFKPQSKTQFNSKVKELTNNFKQSIIPKEVQKIIDSIEKGGNTWSPYALEGMNLNAEAKLTLMINREVMENTLDLRTGKTYAEIVDTYLGINKAMKAIEATETKSVNSITKKAGLPKNVSHASKKVNIKNRDRALELGRKRKKNPRGMSTFDFDETLIVKGKNFVTATKDGKSIKISSEKFPIDGPKLAEQGYKFDFKDFVNVKGGVEGPLFKKLQNQIAKYGNENVFVLTARQAEATPAIHAWLKSKGIELPIENITGLGKSEGEAKAMWMLKKFAEGYNDMYFVDDALPNVKAVKDVLNQLDIKSKVQQALASVNVELNARVNNMMESTFGIESKKIYSKAEGKIRGKDIKRRRVFMPDAAGDLELLIEPLYGKGKKGIEDKKWFNENFQKPWERGINDFNHARQAVMNDYMSLRKQNKDVVKSLDKPVEGSNFTTDMALRVYIWNKSGFKIPDLTKTSKDKLVNHVLNNPKLLSYAESVARLTKLETGLKKPSTEWWGETIAGEISALGEGIGRKKYIQDWIDVKNEMFSEANLNKMESVLGTRWRESVEDMFDRMETGRTRSQNLGRTGNEIMNYLNGSVGTIMNFNTRSATLQLISSVNFINHSFNNPLAAGRAFANQPQYWKDFMTIMNSDMLKQRRAGLEINVTEAELASAAKGSKNPAKAVIAKILKAGYIPTKIADSFAIASGGATYYRNAIRKYTKEGLSKTEAEKKAWIDFQAIAEKTQQSSRPDLLSQQQTSFAGRLILPFANTPMQMNRIMMKEYLDLSKGRYEGFYGDNSFTHKMSKISYYGFVQSAIFAGLQSGLFALMTNSDDDELKAKKKVQAMNTMADSFLRGMGIQGAVLAGIKNAILEFKNQNDKGFGADYSEVGEDLLNISPTIGSKFGKLDAAGNTYKYNKEQILEEGFEFSLDNPALEATTQVVEAVFNIPVNRAHKKTTNIQNALDDNYEDWQRISVGLGWSEWDVGIGQEKVAKEKKEKKEKKAKKKKESQQRCTAIKSTGGRCKIMVKKPKTRCHYHD